MMLLCGRVSQQVTDVGATAHERDSEKKLGRALSLAHHQCTITAKRVRPILARKNIHPPVAIMTAMTNRTFKHG
jgi:hypothetical protein